MSKIIPGRNIGQATQWKMPEMSNSSQTSEHRTTYYDGIAALGGGIPTAKEIDRLQKQAYEAGHREGYEDGLNIAKDEQIKISSALSELLNEFSNLRGYIDSEVKKQMSELAILIAKHIIRREIVLSSKCILTVVEESINLLPVFSRDIKVHLNPQDVDVIKELLAASDEKSPWNIVEDAGISRGGCKVISHSSVLDNTVEMQISKIAAKFLDHYEEDQDVKV